MGIIFLPETEEEEGGGGNIIEHPGNRSIFCNFLTPIQKLVSISF